jgi:hypothetical protein
MDNTISKFWSRICELSIQLPKKAPTIVIESFPKKKAVKNLAGLYFIKPNGMTTGSSGIGWRQQQKAVRNAHRLTFWRPRQGVVAVFC